MTEAGKGKAAVFGSQTADVWLVSFASFSPSGCHSYLINSAQAEPVFMNLCQHTFGLVCWKRRLWSWGVNFEIQNKSLQGGTASSADVWALAAGGGVVFTGGQKPQAAAALCSLTSALPKVGEHLKQSPSFSLKL